MDSGTKREQSRYGWRADSMRDVYAMRGCMCVQVGAMQKCDVCYMCATQCMLCGTGRRDGVRMQGMRYAAGEACKMGRNGAERAENRGIVDILYDGFRKCFVNCKFTFYITLSSYYKKPKIPKTSKRHSKM